MSPASEKVRLAPIWIRGEPLDSVPADLISVLADSTGLRIVSAEELSSHDPNLLLIGVSKPVLGAGDTIRVSAGWERLGRGAGDPNWGVEYYFRMLCRPDCRIVKELGPDVWN